MSKTLCIYHGNCADGFGAACVVRKYFKERLGTEIDFYSGVYQQDPPDVTQKDIIFVDFSYKRAVMEKIIRDAASVRILDHHKTAIDDLKGLDFTESVFDTQRSGAMIAWNYYFSDKPSPPIIAHIQDRDLWRFKLPGTREIQANLFSFPYKFELWEKFFDLDYIDETIQEFAKQGEAIERKHFKDIRELLKVCRKKLVILGKEVNAANLPYTLSSDAGHIMCEEENEPFGCCFYFAPDGIIFSLRSINKKEDVSFIASRFGGGGHRNAAGFKIKDWTSECHPVDEN